MIRYNIIIPYTVTSPLERLISLGLDITLLSLRLVPRGLKVLGMMELSRFFISLFFNGVRDDESVGISVELPAVAFSTFDGKLNMH